MKRRIKIIVALTFLLCGKVFSQLDLTHLLTEKTLKTNGSVVSDAAFLTNKTVFNPTGNQTVTQAAEINQLILPDYYTRNFGFFCQKEWQIEKVTKIPLRFRLGSLDYCNKLEGK